MSISLIVLAVLGWLSFIFAPKDTSDEEIQAHLDIAHDFLERGLYQKAIEEYDEAIKIDSKREYLWIEKMDIYETLYEENNDQSIYKAYMADAKKAIVLFPSNPEFHITTAKLYVVKKDYQSAYKTLCKAVDIGVSNDELLNLQFETKYAFKKESTKYTEARDILNDYYEALDFSGWVFLDESGVKAKYPNFTFAGPIGEDTVRFVSEKDNEDNEVHYLMNEDMVIQGYFDFQPDDVGVPSEGFIAVKTGEKYSYYNFVGDIQFNGAEFDFAGTFNKGTAAVKKDNKWYIIDKEGNLSSEVIYEDIILNTDFTYIKNDVKSVKAVGESLYSVYVKDELIGQYENVSFVSDDKMIAVCQNGKWGFINLKGEFVIEPQFVEARSFSNGFAAVSNGDSWGFVNKKGELAIPYQFIEVGNFNSKGKCLALFERQDNSIGSNFNKDEEQEKEIEYEWHFISLYNV